MSKRIVLICLPLVLSGCLRIGVQETQRKKHRISYLLTTKSGETIELSDIELDADSERETFQVKTSTARVEIPNKFADFQRMDFLGETLGRATVRITYSCGEVLEGQLQGFPTKYQKFYGKAGSRKLTIKLQDVQSIERNIEEVQEL